MPSKKVTPMAAIICEKMSSGKQLTDTEIRFGRQYYRELAERLVVCGPVFQLAYEQALKLANWLDDTAKARKVS